MKKNIVTLNILDNFISFENLPLFEDSYTNPPRGGPSIDAMPRNNTKSPNVDVSESIPNRSTRTFERYRRKRIDFMVIRKYSFTGNESKVYRNLSK